MNMTDGFLLHVFFQRLQQEFGTMPDLGKYMDVLKMLRYKMEDGHRLTEELLYDVFRFLLCEQFTHEKRFKEVFGQVYKKEVVDKLNEILAKKKADETPIVQPPPPRPDLPPTGPNIKPVIDPQDTDPTDENPITEPWSRRPAVKYLNFQLAELEGTTLAAPETSLDTTNEHRYYLQTDDYNAISFREMIQSWRYFRLRRVAGVSDEIDVPKTVKQIAQDGFFTFPKYKTAYKSREDSLLILVDRQGSMVPFHALSDSLVRTAIKDGGHHRAMVYYFKNYPLEYVYKTPYLTDPVKLDELLSTVNNEHTYAIIISDAGAARGNMNEGRVRSSGIEMGGVQNTLRSGAFLQKLVSGVKDLVWLNPMPRNRWKGTSAAAIYNTLGIKMHSIYDAGMLGFTNAVKDLLNEN
ncbi:MAG: hypothetical protein IT258_13715 [Saprospiraceae bacterium]|nr:hypothetical protein [Saprospiraceae bacterium]